MALCLGAPLPRCRHHATKEQSFQREAARVFTHSVVCAREFHVPQMCHTTVPERDVSCRRIFCCSYMIPVDVVARVSAGCLVTGICEGQCWPVQDYAQTRPTQITYIGYQGIARARFKRVSPCGSTSGLSSWLPGPFSTTPVRSSSRRCLAALKSCREAAASGTSSKSSPLRTNTWSKKRAGQLWILSSPNANSAKVSNSNIFDAVVRIYCSIERQYR